MLCTKGKFPICLIGKWIPVSGWRVVTQIAEQQLLGKIITVTGFKEGPLLYKTKVAAIHFLLSYGNFVFFSSIKSLEQRLRMCRGLNVSDAAPGGLVQHYLLTTAMLVVFLNSFHRFISLCCGLCLRSHSIW